MELWTRPHKNNNPPLLSMMRPWHFHGLCQGSNRFAAANKRTWSGGSFAGDRHDGGLKKTALDKLHENAKTLTMESKDEFGRKPLKAGNLQPAQGLLFT